MKTSPSEAPLPERGFERLGRADGRELARVHEGHRLAKLVGFLHVVRGHQNRGSEFFAEIANILPDGLFRDGIEPHGRLIEEKNRRAVQHGLGDFEVSDHTARILLHKLIGDVRQSP